MKRAACLKEKSAHPAMPYRVWVPVRSSTQSRRQSEDPKWQTAAAALFNATVRQAPVSKASYGSCSRYFDLCANSRHQGTGGRGQDGFLP